MRALVLLVGCSAAIAVVAATGASSAPHQSGDTTEPYPIDRGGRPGTPATYKGLVLGLADTGAPRVSAVDGRIGVVCIGMSNASQECADFETRLARRALPGVAPGVRVANCAVGSHAIERWTDPAYDEVLWHACTRVKIPAAGLRPDQVRVVWHKAASQLTTDDTGRVLPPYPDPASDYFRFRAHLAAFSVRVRDELPSVQAVYTSSRSYGGYATRQARGEPLSYEEGLALNSWLAERDPSANVWFGWGPYLWAPDCATGVRNSGGVCYERTDYQADGIHPAAGAREKVSRLLDARFRQHDWYAPARALVPLTLRPRRGP